MTGTEVLLDEIVVPIGEDNPRKGEASVVELKGGRYEVPAIFHRTLVEIASQDHLLRAWSGVGVLTFTLSAFTGAGWSRRSGDVLSLAGRHRRIVDLLRTRNAEQAGTAVRRTILERIFDACGVSEAELRRQIPGPLIDEVARLRDANG